MLTHVLASDQFQFFFEVDENFDLLIFTIFLWYLVLVLDFLFVIEKRMFVSCVQFNEEDTLFL